MIEYFEPDLQRGQDDLHLEIRRHPDRPEDVMLTVNDRIRWQVTVENEPCEELLRPQLITGDFPSMQTLAREPTRLIEELLGKDDFYQVALLPKKRETHIVPVNIFGTLGENSLGRRPMMVVLRLPLPTHVRAEAASDGHEMVFTLDRGNSPSGSQRWEVSVRHTTEGAVAVTLSSSPRGWVRYVAPWDSQ